MRIATVAIVGGDSLMAREVHDVFSQQAPDLGVKLTGLEGEGAVITEQGGGPALKALACEQIEVWTEDEEPPTNVGAAGQSGMTVGVVETDRRHPRCAWFWIVADNNRTSAENAVCLARLLIPGEGRA
jgi:aspartate-semialdehyde dehydrogenase